MKIYFRVLPMSLAMAQAWHVGLWNDCDLVEEAGAVALPCPAWCVLSVTGGPAGGRQTLAWLRATAADGVCQAFVWRTSVYGLARLAERWGGVRGFREEDERERWWVEAAAVRGQASTRTSV